MLMIMTCISVQAGFLLHSKVDNSGVHQSTLKPLSYCVIKKKKKSYFTTCFDAFKNLKQCHIACRLLCKSAYCSEYFDLQSAF